MMQLTPNLNDRAARIRSILGQLITFVSVGATSAGDGEAIATQLRTGLEDLGVTFVKLGQTLSTRRDLLPEVYTTELAKLTHEARPMPWPVVEAQLKRVFGESLSAVFLSIDPDPIGSASLAQVHAAVLNDGREVAVKVMRPGCIEQVLGDLALLRSLAHGADGLGAGGETFQFGELVESFALATELELDYRVEARNLRTIHDGLADFERIRVPLPIEGCIFTDVLVMERLRGVPLIQLDRPPQDGSELANTLCGAYLHQVLELGFFHADPHPGNLLLLDDGRLGLIDMGMAEVIDNPDQLAFAQLVSGLAQGSTVDVFHGLLRLSEELDSADPVAMRAAAHRAVRRAVALRGVEPTMGATTYALLRSMVDHGYRPRAQLSVLARTLAMLDEGLSRLDPHCDAEAAARDYAGTHLWREVRSFDPGLPLAQLARRSPRALGRVVDELANGTFTVRVDAFDERTVLTSIRKVANRIAGALIVASLVVGGAITGSLDVGALSTPGVILLGMGAIGAATLLTSILIFDR